MCQRVPGSLIFFQFGERQRPDEIRKGVTPNVHNDSGKLGIEVAREALLGQGFWGLCAKCVQ